MIAKKVEAVTKRLEKLKFQVEAPAWRVIREAMTELIDISANVRAVELRLRNSTTTAGLDLAEAFTEPDADGKFKVSLARVGHLLGDIAQVLQDDAGRRPGFPRKSKARAARRQPGLALVSGDGGQP